MALLSFIPYTLLGLFSSLVLQDTTLKETPYIAGVYTDGALKCTGAILSENLVITAAWCVYDLQTLKKTTPSRIFVKAGDYNLSIVDSFEEQRSVKKIHFPPNYHDKHQITDGMAILELRQPFKLSEFIQPISISEFRTTLYHHHQPPSSGSIIVWGKQKDTSSSMELYKMQIPLMKPSECSKLLGRVHGSLHEVCSEPLKKITCVGSTGTPLLTGNKLELYGILNQGLNCDGKESKGAVFTRISPYHSWIKKVIKQNTVSYSSGTKCLTYYISVLFCLIPFVFKNT